MTVPGPVRAGGPVSLYERVGYDASLEALAYRRLSELDTEGCRAALAQLVDQLDLSGNVPGDRQIVLLLLDVLLEVNRRIHPPGSAGAQYAAHRQSLLDRFAAYEDPEEARGAFLPALNGLLGQLRPHALGVRALVEKAQAFIEDHYQERLSLSRVALDLHVSPNYLSRLFRKETGTTLTAYIHRLRMEHARLLLAAGDRSISEIAYLVGYQNYRDFYRNFVKHEKASPKQVQRRFLSRSGSASAP